MSGGSVYLVLVSIFPILMTSYRHDDTINRLYPSALTSSGQPLLGSLAREFTNQVGMWMTNQGRFFPGSVAWTLSVFSVFRTRETYKLLVWFLALLMVVLVIRVVVSLTRNAATGAIVVVSFCTTLTLRNYADALDSFAGLLPLTIALAFGSALLLLRYSGWPSAICAMMLWSIALTTYEVVILLAPTLCIAIWLSGRGTTRSLALLIPTVADAAFVLVLRSRAVSEASGYTTNLDLVPVATTYLKQSAAALPLVQIWYPGADAPHISMLLVLMAVVLVAVPAALVLVGAIQSRPNPTWRSIGIVTLIGATCWLAPPVLIGITLRWQTSIPLGQGYLSVVWGYVGVAVLFAMGWLALAKAFGGRRHIVGNVALATATAALSLLAALNAAQSFSIASALAFPVS